MLVQVKLYFKIILDSNHPNIFRVITKPKYCEFNLKEKDFNYLQFFNDLLFDFKTLTMFFFKRFQKKDRLLGEIQFSAYFSRKCKFFEFDSIATSNRVFRIKKVFQKNL